MESLRLFNDASVRRRLYGVVERLAGNSSLRQDLMQEALIQLWLMEDKSPGQSQAWYLQACRYHLQNYLRLGRSVDSWKHLAAGQPQDIDGGDDSQGAEGNFDSFQSNEGFWDEIYAKDLISAISPWLTAVETKILNGLADGLSAREIGQRLDISHTMVNRHRRKIAILALKLGIDLPNRATNGHERRRLKEFRQPRATANLYQG